MQNKQALILFAISLILLALGLGLLVSKENHKSNRAVFKTLFTETQSFNIVS